MCRADTGPLICFPGGCSAARVGPRNHSFYGRGDAATQVHRWLYCTQSTGGCPQGHRHPPTQAPAPAGLCAGTCWGNLRSHPGSSASVHPPCRSHLPHSGPCPAGVTAMVCYARQRSPVGRTQLCSPGLGRLLSHVTGPA